MANDYYFFTDINQQASNASDYINVQPPGDAFGPITPGTASTDDEYRVTSLHTALNFAPVKYIIYKGILESSLVNGLKTAGHNGLTKSTSVRPLFDVGNAAGLDDLVKGYR